MKQRKLLLLLTNTYPYGYGESFLETEISYLSESFDEIYICPFRNSDYSRTIPENAHVVDTLTKGKNILIWLKYCFLTLISEEFQKAIGKLRVDKKILNFPKTGLFFCKALYIKENIIRFVNANGLKYDDIVFYSYWLTSGAFGLGLVRKQQAGIKLIARAHGYDLYAKRYLTGYIPLQPETIGGLDKLYPISNDGYQYLVNKYKTDHPELISKMEVSRLGVKKGGLVKKRKKDDSLFLIVTCSSFIPTKRIDLLIGALSILDITVKDKKIEWHHIGGGKRRMFYEKKAKKSLSHHVSFRFHGTLTNKDVLNLYRNHRFDLFVNVSDSEGIPVSIMEAISFGIPVLARNVGGISEIINNENGILLEETISPQSLADAVSKIMSAEKEWLAKRRKAFKTWSRKFNADRNYKIFVDSLINK